MSQSATISSTGTGASDHSPSGQAFASRKPMENEMSAQPIETIAPAIKPAKPHKAGMVRIQAIRQEVVQPEPVRALDLMPHWKKRPDEWQPYSSFSEAMGAYEASSKRSLAACVARMALSAPFIKGGPTEATIALSFSRSIDEAVSKSPNIPADLVSACREEEAARDAHRVVRQRLTQTPADGADILRKLRFITQEFDDCLSPQDHRDAYRHPDSFPLSFEFYALHDDVVRNLNLHREKLAERHAWDAVVAEHQAAGVACRAAPEADLRDYDHAADVAAEAEGRLMRAPAPDVRALAEKMRLSLRYLVESSVEDNIDDPRSIAAALACGDSGDREQVLIYQDALRLADMRPDIASVVAFNPQHLIDAATDHMVGLQVVEDEEQFRLVVQIGEGVSDDLRNALADLRQNERQVLREALRVRAARHCGTKVDAGCLSKAEAA